ncbi:MAG: glycosyltransferase family 4 protein [Bacteroidaceae bacterium]|nr:glycosyltransferase family 4 protein [Bacteroidaceae bacterium]
MRVLICIPCLMTGGTEILTLNLVHSLVHGGHDVTTACYFEYSDDMVQRYKKAGSKVVLCSKDGIRTGGIKGIMFLFVHLRMVLKMCKPDIVHVQYMAPGAIPIILLKLLGVKTIVATVHTAADIYPSLKLVHFIQRYCVKVWTCITQRAEESFFGTSQLYTTDTILKKHNHFTIYNSLPYGMQSESSKFQVQSFRKLMTIGVVSRLEHIKGMDLVIPAFAKVKQSNPEIDLIIVGDGSLKDLMQHQAIDLKCSESVRFVGRQPQEELNKWYRQMDVVLMPSRSEGFGLTAIEAMANGCVVVASNVGGLPEIVEDGRVGLLHANESVDDIVEKVNVLFDDEQMYVQMKEYTQVYVQQYSFKNFSELFNDLYKKI